MCVCDESKRYINIHEISWGSRGKLIMKFFINDFLCLKKEAKKLMFVSFKVFIIYTKCKLIFKFIFKLIHKKRNSMNLASYT